MRRSCTPDHVTASVLVLSPDGGQALLTLHARSGRWFQTGGHLEDGDTTLAGAALREGREETGIDDLALVGDDPVVLDRHEVSCRTPGALRHLDVQYVAVASAVQQPVVSAESLDVRWFGVDDLPDGADASVRALVSAGVARLAAQSSGSEPALAPRSAAAGASSDSPRLAAVENPSR